MAKSITRMVQKKTSILGRIKMELADFNIGLIFFTGSGKWICTDIGTRTITASKIENDIIEDLEVVFDSFDFGGCSKINELRFIK